MDILVAAFFYLSAGQNVVVDVFLVIIGPQSASAIFEIFDIAW